MHALHGHAINPGAYAAFCPKFMPAGWSPSVGDAFDGNLNESGPDELGRSRYRGCNLDVVTLGPLAVGGAGEILRVPSDHGLLINVTLAPRNREANVLEAMHWWAHQVSLNLRLGTVSDSHWPGCCRLLRWSFKLHCHNLKSTLLLKFKLLFIAFV